MGRGVGSVSGRRKCPESEIRLIEFRVHRDTNYLNLKPIVIDRGRTAVPINRVNPLYIKYLEQIRVDESPNAILIDPDLL